METSSANLAADSRRSDISSAVSAARERFRGRRVAGVILISDGGDTTSAMSFGQMLDLLKASDVTVYAVGYLEHEAGSARLQQRSELQRAADTTGGRAYFPENAKAFQEAYRQMAQLVRHEYSLAFAPPVADGAAHAIDVKVNANTAGSGVGLATTGGTL